MSDNRFVQLHICIAHACQHSFLCIPKHSSGAQLTHLYSVPISISLIKTYFNPYTHMGGCNLAHEVNSAYKILMQCTQYHLHRSDGKQLVPSCLHELHESKLLFVLSIKFIRSKLSIFSAHVSGVSDEHLGKCLANFTPRDSQMSSMRQKSRLRMSCCERHSLNIVPADRHLGSAKCHL